MILLEVGAGASIASMVVPAGGAIIAVPFDAVSCDQFPADCARWPDFGDVRFHISSFHFARFPESRTIKTNSI